MRKGSGEYPPGWKKFAKELKDEAGWRCIRCGHRHDPKAGYCLTVHHATMAKDEPFDHWWAFLVLCQKCHLRVQGKVNLDQGWMLPHSTWFRPYVAGYYAYIHGFPTDRAWVIEHVDELIAIGQGRRHYEHLGTRTAAR